MAAQGGSTKRSSTARAGVIFGYWWIATFPGIAILLAVIGANLLGEGMWDLLDPRLRV